jgi:ABC-type phosphate transport system substrate-binding protein
MRRSLPNAIGLLILLSLNICAAGDLVVIVNPASGVRSMTRDEVAKIFLARYRRLPSGTTALPLDLGADSVQRRDFYQRLVGKQLPDINAYWARLLFSGRATPPFQVVDDAAAMQAVAENKGAIAYVDKRAVDARVRIVLELGD